MSKVSRVISGGHAGVDRAALDAAIALDIPYGGWVPLGGRAEDGVKLLEAYPRLTELATSDYPTRTRRNVESADATLIICPVGLLPTSKGTLLTVKCADRARKPKFVMTREAQLDDVAEWLRDRVLIELRYLTLNVAGPRGSGWTAGYETTRRIVTELLAS